MSSGNGLATAEKGWACILVEKKKTKRGKEQGDVLHAELQEGTSNARKKGLLSIDKKDSEKKKGGPVSERREILAQGKDRKAVQNMGRRRIGRKGYFGKGGNTRKEKTILNESSKYALYSMERVS